MEDKNNWRVVFLSSTFLKLCMASTLSRLPLRGNKLHLLSNIKYSQAMHFFMEAKSFKSQ